MKSIVVLLFTGAVIFTTARPVAAQVTFPLQNPSARAAAMGGASAAVPWSNLSSWANPALLAYANGLTLRKGQAYLTYFAPMDIRFSSGGLEFGWGGMGLAYNRERIDLDLQPTVKFPKYDLYSMQDRWGGAISLAGILQTIRGPGEFRLARYADLGVGLTHKRMRQGFRGALGPGLDRSANDLGLLVRLTPVALAPGGRMSLDLTYGYSYLQEPYYTSTGTRVHHRHGVGVRIGRRLLDRDSTGHVIEPPAQGAGRLVIVTFAADFDQFDDPSIFGGSEASNDLGGEIEFPGGFAVRFGHIRDEVQGLDGFCYGFGIAPRIGRVARLRYDYARFPSGGGDTRGNRHAVSMWLDPIAMIRQ